MSEAPTPQPSGSGWKKKNLIIFTIGNRLVGLLSKINGEMTGLAR